MTDIGYRLQPRAGQAPGDRYGIGVRHHLIVWVMNDKYFAVQMSTPRYYVPVSDGHTVTPLQFKVHALYDVDS